MKKSQTPCDLRRRKFLKLSGLLGLGALAGTLLPPAGSEAFLFGKKEYKVTKTRLAMGTFVAMTAIHPSRDEAENAIGLAFEEIDRLAKLLSHYEQTTPIAELNLRGKLVSPPSEVEEVIGRSLYFYKQTGGAFDITVKPLIDLYKKSFAAELKPTDRQIETALESVGSHHIVTEGKGFVMTKPEMGITLDGIAKGYIVDRASEVLSKNGIANHLINAGGDIKTCGTAAKGRAWTIAVQDPSKKKEYPDVITMADGAIATSGNYEIFYDREKIFHHIVNSQTGRSPSILSSVTVIADSVMDADAMATAAFVMEPQDGLGFIENKPACECFLIRQNGEFIHSSGWQSS